MKRLLAGFVAGLIATVPMTIFMVIMNKWVAKRDDRSLPPYKITMRVLDKLIFWRKLVKQEKRSALAMVAHFAYGGLAGALYGLVAPLASLPAFFSSALYGLIFWAANYIGALPALGLYPNNLKEEPERRVELIGSHLVWGTALGVAFEQIFFRDNGFLQTR